MIPELIKENIFLEDGRVLSIETGELARKANGSVVVRLGNTSLLATVVISKEDKEYFQFIPLTISYREKYSACGKIPGGYIKREGRPSDEEILTMRLVDRLLRPLFKDNYYNEIQIIISLLSYEMYVFPDVLAGLVASTAVSISEIDLKGPVSTVRIIRINDAFIINPGIEEMKNSYLDLIVGGSKNYIILVEGEMREISEIEMMEAIVKAHKHIQLQIEAQTSLVTKTKNKNKNKKKKKKRDNIEFYNYYYKYIYFNLNVFYIKEKIKFLYYEDIYYIYKSCLFKQKRSKKIENILKKIKFHFYNESIVINNIDIIFDEIKKEIIKNIIFKENNRLDGRSLDDLRKIWSQVDCLPGVHGSAIFTRGETQALSTITLGSSLDINQIDNAIIRAKQRFYLHYNFPPFSTGEMKLLKGVSRREIGHGNLAQRALKKIIPFVTPYTIRVVSDVLESNGSSSMATVCASTLALMDSGITLKRPVSGISMGLIMNYLTGEAIILSDILGDEDYIGDMDFKITGTEYGITACQMDIKISGITYDVLSNTIFKAKKGLLFLIKNMLRTLSFTRKSLKITAPKIYTFYIPIKWIGAVIGSGGQIIQIIQLYTETIIKIKEKNGLGVIEILGTNETKLKIAILKIKNITFVPKVGTIYKAKVKNIKRFGVFVKISKSVEGLLHRSEMSWKRLTKVESFIRKGDIISVKYLGKYKKFGKIKLSHKILFSRDF
ncbi:polyribonucleotide nucleotidyltransferase [Candidatus Karelsulcia muelleri]|uniref:Polyribonucleotide nucleotidyltransferase n=1 Tax=Candidatus Karelsulcia muelleri TaxID=336810 RepID=A0A3A1MJR5_9FLAO|nr:polyribonucleotide nucleotidyltransferase [Candidatus Karelsulcia muelleri]RIU86057.1 polyribonucleotide nucleotidyltransferase [Candidatus Karelsulcia muelleri]